MAESLGYDVETYTPDNLISGDAKIVTESVTLIAGQNLSRGDLLGKITASGKYTLSLAAAGDGSETPVAILAKDTDATSEDLSTIVYLSGEFNEDAVGFGTGHTAASTKDDLRALNIYLQSPESA